MKFIELIRVDVNTKDSTFSEETKLFLKVEDIIAIQEMQDNAANVIEGISMIILRGMPPVGVKGNIKDVMEAVEEAIV